jgi:hypothetical protein
MLVLKGYKKWRVKHINESTQHAPALVLVDRGKPRKPPLFITSTVKIIIKIAYNTGIKSDGFSYGMRTVLPMPAAAYD